MEPQVQSIGPALYKSFIAGEEIYVRPPYKPVPVHNFRIKTE